MQTLRTPDEHFAHLDGFGYEPHYAEVADPTGGDPIRMAWVEDGPADGEVVLLLHGEPSWSYLYRSMIPPLAAAGLRVIAPDLVGFGRSDKPAQQDAHSYARHVEWVRELVVDRLDLPTGDVDMPEIWHRFRQAVQNSPSLDVGRFVASGCVRGLSDAARAAYDAPFPDESFKAGPRAMPGLVPYRPDYPASAANRAAWQRLAASPTPMLVAFSDSDPITGGMRPILERTMAGAAGRTHPVVADAGHFLQEDAGPELSAAILRFVQDT